MIVHSISFLISGQPAVPGKSLAWKVFPKDDGPESNPILTVLTFSTNNRVSQNHLNNMFCLHSMPFTHLPTSANVFNECLSLDVMSRLKWSNYLLFSRMEPRHCWETIREGFRVFCQTLQSLIKSFQRGGNIQNRSLPRKRNGSEPHHLEVGINYPPQWYQNYLHRVNTVQNYSYGKFTA